MSKGQLEAKISEIVSKFEVVNSGRGPKRIRAYIIGDMIIVRMVCLLSQAEKRMAATEAGVELFKNVNVHLFEEGKGQLEMMLKEAFDITIVSAHMDFSTRTGEKIIIFTLRDNLEEKITENSSVSVY